MKMRIGVICLMLSALVGVCTAGYKIGVGVADITGPIDVTLMGYGVLNQIGRGLHLRQWSRAFVFSDGKSRFAFVSVDLGMMGDGVRIHVIKELEKKFNGLYNMDNVMLSATHTHSAPGGFLMHTLFDIPSLGFCNETFNALVNGIVKSITKAHDNSIDGRIFMSRGVLLEANINRSPSSYEANPEEEKKRYQHNVDKEMVQLKLTKVNGDPIGVISWFAVHATSMNNTNTLISSDNAGYASLLFEEKVNPRIPIGRKPFVAAFASSNLGDVSPNVRGPKCHISGEECDKFSKCRNESEECYATGPGGDDLFESTRIIAERMFEKAWELFKGPSEEITGPIRSIHQYVDMPKAETEIYNKTTGKMEKVRGCKPAMGYSAGAGTTDGPFLPFLKQGQTEPVWWLDALTHILVKPTEEDIKCHAPKPILLLTGQLNDPFEWQPHIVSTQLAFLGNLTLVCVPGEFTTMSGRRMREAVAETLRINPKNVVIVGLCNTYSDYIATYEEYQVQRYEAASTIYGPHTLSLHLSQYKKLATALMKNEKLDRGPEPSGLDSSKMFSLIPPVAFDSSSPYSFGQVLKQPMTDVKPGDTVFVTFVSGHPRNDLRHDDTYLTVERFEDGKWIVVATDAHWQTKMKWRRTSRSLGTSQIDIEWNIPKDMIPGNYRIQHFGAYKDIKGTIFSYNGVTNTFKVLKNILTKRKFDFINFLTFPKKR